MAATGGSTNAVLHLLAIANEAGVELALEDFNRIAMNVPHLADMKTASMSLVGLDATAAQAQLGNSQGALSNLVAPADAVCS